jgi:hypothetical protein
MFIGVGVEKVSAKTEDIVAFTTTQTEMFSIGPMKSLNEGAIENVVHVIRR